MPAAAPIKDLDLPDPRPVVTFCVPLDKGVDMKKVALWKAVLDGQTFWFTSLDQLKAQFKL